MNNKLKSFCAGTKNTIVRRSSSAEKLPAVVAQIASIEPVKPGREAGAPAGKPVLSGRRRRITVTGAQIFAYLQAGHTRKSAAVFFGISCASVGLVLRRDGFPYKARASRCSKEQEKANRKKYKSLRLELLAAAPAPRGKCTCCKRRKIARGNRFLCELCFHRFGAYRSNAAAVA